MDDDTDVQKAIERIRLELVTRKFMVVVLALIAVWTGIAMCMTGAPAFLETWFSPWSRYVFGGIAFAGGLLMSIGAVMGDERPSGWWTQVTGLWVTTIWYVGMAIAYIGLSFSEGLHIVGPGRPLDPGVSGRGYVPIVYIGLAVMTATPLATMLRLKYSRHTP